MDWLQAPDYWLARLVLQRALGAVYLVAFLVAARQFVPLLGERGLLPVPRFVAAVSFPSAPSLLHLRYSDRLPEDPGVARPPAGPDRRDRASWNLAPFP